MTQKDSLPTEFNETSLVEAARSVALLDEDLARILTDHGTPPLWAREPGFVTLIRIILEQQVSLISAEAMYQRLIARVKPLSAEEVLSVGASFLQSFGVTRQKAGYFINVATAIEEGTLDLDMLGFDSDEGVIEKLTAVKGIGPWTAKIYLLMALRRPDVWPVGDIALASAVGHLKKLPERPTQPQLTEIAMAWQPYRATAARLLWNYYLKGM